MEALHVYPLDDLHEHFLWCVYPAVGHPYCPCKCNPTFEEQGDEILVIHNSFDGREVFEQAAEMIKHSTN